MDTGSTSGFTPGAPGASGSTGRPPSGSGSGGRRNRKAVIESDPEDEEESLPTATATPTTSSTPAYSMDTDISLLEAPTFTTLDNRGPSRPMLDLQWDHKVNLIGKKV